MVRIHLLSLLLAVTLILLSNFSRYDVQASVISVNRRLLNVGDDNNPYQQYMRKIIKNRRFALRPAELELLNALRKRQMIRYHPCYFNPVSCFRKK